MTLTIDAVDIISAILLVPGFVSIFFGALASFQSLKLRHIMVDSIYRKRAIALAAINLNVCAFLAFALISYLNLFFLVLANFVIGPIAIILLMAVLITSVDVAVDQDYLHRNTLYWRNLKLPFAAIVIFIGISTIIGKFVFNYNEEGNLIAVGILTVALAYGCVTLALSIIRSKDLKIRETGRWFALTVVVFLIANPLAISTNLFLREISFIPIVVAAYFLFRATKAQSPLNRIIVEKSREI